MQLRRRILYLSMPLLLLAGCSKEYRQHWLVADIRTFDYYTAKPVSNCNVTLCYQKKTGFGSVAVGPENLGFTNESGYLHVEHKIPGKAYDLKINLWPPKQYATPFLFTNFNCEEESGQEVFAKSLNVVTKKLIPYSWYRLHVVNTNCFDETDSIRIHISGNNPNFPSHYYTLCEKGCADTLIPYPESTNGTGYMYTQQPHIYLEKKIYRNGWDTTITEQYDLPHDGTVKVIDVLY